jgi:magnesium transporter
MSFYAVHRGADGTVRTGLTMEEAVASFRGGEGLLWLDLEDPGEPERELLTGAFGFHPVPVDACISPELHSPTAADYEGYLFLNVHGIDYSDTSALVTTTEVGVFLGAHYVVSAHNVPVHAVGTVRRSIEGSGVHWPTPDLLAHVLVDTLVANVQPTVDRMTERADELEEQALRQPHQHLMEGILALRRSASGLHRVMVSQQASMARVSRGDVPHITSGALPYFRDTQEQLWRITEYCQTLRERADSALTTYMGSVAYRQNESMRVLTVVAAIFLPLSLVTGIFGMNFENMPQLHWSWAYYAVVGAIATVVGVMTWVFWVRRWLRMRLERELRWARPFTVELERLVTLPRDVLRTSAAAQAQAQASARPHPHAHPLQTGDDERDD